MTATGPAAACESCGGEGRLRVWSLADVVGFEVECSDCGGTGTFPPETSEEES